MLAVQRQVQVKYLNGVEQNGLRYRPTSTGGSGIALTDLSVSVASNFGQGKSTYNNSTGVFIFTPPDLSSYSTSAVIIQIYKDCQHYFW